MADAIAGYNPHRPRPSDLSGLRKNLRQRPDGRWAWHWDPRFISGRFGSQDETRSSLVDPARLRLAAKELTIPVKLTYLKDKLSARTPGKNGDLLVIRSTFKIKRSDFNIQPGQGEDKVSDEIELTLSIAGASPK